MIGTTGVASNWDTLFIANNKVITKIDRMNVKRDIPHGFDRIEDIAVSEHNLAGIYVKDEVYGIFLMDLRTSEYKTNQSLTYEPYRIGFLPSEFLPSDATDETIIYTMDNKQKIYLYDIFLIKKETEINPSDIKFNEVDIAFLQNQNQIFLMSSTDIKEPGGTKLDIQVEGEFLTMVPFLHYLFIGYLSHYNMYSIIQYDTKTNTVVKQVDGGYFSTRIYMCIHGYSLYISSTLNRVFPLSSFSLAKEELETKKDEYPLFLENGLTPNLKEVELTIDLAKIKERKQSFSVDTKTAESSLFKYYIWAIVATLFIILIYISFMTPPTGAVNIVLVLVLVAVVIFIIHSYI